MKTKRFLTEAAIFSIALALIFSGCGDSGGGGGGGDTLEGVSSSGEAPSLAAELSSSGGSEEASSGSGEGLCAGFDESAKREHYGTEKKQFCDKRDGKKYFYVEIGSQIWMAENLNYAGENGSVGSCYDGDDANCETYGRLYNWATALAGSEPSYANPSSVQGICPDGWHLPSSQEWSQLVVYVQNNIRGASNNTATKLRTSILWGASGTDEAGFSALPGGAAGAGQGGSITGYDMGVAGYWWTSSDAYLGGTARYYSINFSSIGNNEKNRDAYFSVRCVNGNPSEGGALAGVSSSSSNAGSSSSLAAEPPSGGWEGSCPGNPQEYDPALFECRSGKNGVYLKEDFRDADGEEPELRSGGQQVLRRQRYHVPRVRQVLRRGNRQKRVPRRVALAKQRGMGDYVCFCRCQH
jgi:uncharacterized protein (TIGR02145 family)